MAVKHIYLITFIILSVLGVSAQSQPQAEKIISEFINSVDKNAVQTDFTITISEEDCTPMEELKGSFLMKKNKFSLQTVDTKVFYDGKTQWAYVSANNEVTITEPSDDELSEINPFFILNEYHNKSTIRFSENKSNENDIIIMTPDIAGSDFNKIVVQVNKSTKNPVSITLSGKNGYNILIHFSNFRKGINIPEKSFVFDKSNYKGVFENDLR